MTRYPAIHQKCGGVAFYLLKEPLWGDLIEAKHAVLPDGSHPQNGKPIICGSCGKTVESSFRVEPTGVFFPGPVEDDNDRSAS